MLTSNTEVTITYLNIILYALSYQLQRPIEPFLVRSLIHNNSSNNRSSQQQSEESSTNQTYGQLTSFFSAIQTIGSPLVGTLLDAIGIRSTSILVYTGSAASYAILSQASTLNGLYYSKIPTLLQHAFLVGQATVVVSTLEDSAARAAALGRMTTAYTVGATIGPALGGYLGKKSDLYVGARLAVWGSVVSIVLSVVYLKDHHRARDNGNTVDCSGNSAKSSESSRKESCIQSIKRTVSYLRNPSMGPLLFIKWLNGVSSSAFSTILPLILANKLNFGTAELGYYMSVNSFSVAIFACVGIGPTMRICGDRADELAFWGIMFRSSAFVTFALIVTHVMSVTGVDSEAQHLNNNLWNTTILATTLASIVISLASHAHATSLTSLTTGSVTAKERGAILGLEHGLFSMARIVGPPMGTTLLSRGPTILNLGGRGVDGLWRVVFICVLIDLVLLTLLKLWSTRHDAAEIELNDQKSLMNDNDHDHSD
jgi:OCT family organic cation transporter-like MFS transporter 18